MKDELPKRGCGLRHTGPCPPEGVDEKQARCWFCGGPHDWFTSECDIASLAQKKLWVGLPRLMWRVPVKLRSDAVVQATYESLEMSAGMTPGLEKVTREYLWRLLGENPTT